MDNVIKSLLFASISHFNNDGTWYNACDNKE